MRSLLLFVLLAMQAWISAQAQTFVPHSHDNVQGGIAFTPTQAQTFMRSMGFYKNHNYIEAAIGLKKLAEEGNPTAQVMLGGMYFYGQGLPKDDQQAVILFKKSAAQGIAPAQLHLGLMYLNGKGGLPKDDHQAMKWFSKAAEQGDAAAQSELGLMYANGRGVGKNDQEAFKWFLRAAWQGDVVAQSNLGLIYATGRGTLMDQKAAYFWSLLALAKGDVNAQKITNLVSSLLTNDERTSVLRAASNWQPRYTQPISGVYINNGHR